MDRKRAKLEEQQFFFILYVFHLQLHSPIYETKHLHAQRQSEAELFQKSVSANFHGFIGSLIFWIFMDVAQCKSLCYHSDRSVLVPFILSRVTWRVSSKACNSSHQLVNKHSLSTLKYQDITVFLGLHRVQISVLNTCQPIEPNQYVPLFPVIIFS